MKVKVCGLRSPENIAALQELPIDLMGFIFHPKSERFVKAKKLPDDLPREGIQRVGVFVDAGIHTILNAVHDYKLDYVQLHGKERPEYCMELQQLWSLSSMRSAKMIKAFSVDEQFDFSSVHPYEKLCDLFLFDTKGAQPGGNGKHFDWNLLHQYHGITPFLLSGGIGPDDAEAIRELRFPQMAGIDVNSGFETEPGIKSVEKLKTFLAILLPNEEA